MYVTINLLQDDVWYGSNTVRFHAIKYMMPWMISVVLFNTVHDIPKSDSGDSVLILPKVSPVPT